MSEITTSIRTAWAMPIDVFQLGAALEAWKAIKPSAIGLQWCNLKIKRDLSREILDMILAYLFEEELAHQKEVWSRIKFCGEDRCYDSYRRKYGFEDLIENDERDDPRWTNREHENYWHGETQNIISAILQEWWYGDDNKLAEEILGYCLDAGDSPDHIIKGDIWAQIDFMCGNDNDADSEDHVPWWLKDQFGIPRDICKYYADQWNAKIEDPDGFEEYETILRLDFGLSVHISRQYITNSVDEDFQQFWIDRHGDYIEAIQAFLAFPSPTISHKIRNILYFGGP